MAKFGGEVTDLPEADSSDIPGTLMAYGEWLLLAGLFVSLFLVAKMNVAPLFTRLFAVLTGGRLDGGQSESGDVGGWANW